MNKVVLISVYLGKLPYTFEIWKNSCLVNENIDFLFFTDQRVECSNNFKVINIDINALKKMISDKLKINPSFSNPYKLCDFKPTYGKIFEDYIIKYEYWGYCDIDLVFGDLYLFLKENDFEKYDRFLKWGHLSIFKNNIINNEKYLNCEGWKEKLESPNNFAFDERDMINEFENNSDSFFQKEIMIDIDPRFTRFRRTIDFTNYKNQVFSWEKGKTYWYFIDNKIIQKEEIMYIHFQKRKLKIDVESLDSNSCFWIGSNGIIDFMKYKNNIPIKEINPYPGLLFEIWDCLKLKIAREIKKRRFK